MSATNRGAERREADYYPTPAWCVHRLLDRIGPPRGHVLEPAVGDGAIVRAFESWPGNAAPRCWTTLDIRPEAEADITADYTWMGCPALGSKRFDWAITNPPFGEALGFAQESLMRADNVALLLRISWLASEERAEFLRESMPSVYVLPNRPSFTGDGKTDAADYAWMVWWGGNSRASVEILDSTPAEQR